MLPEVKRAVIAVAEDAITIRWKHSAIETRVAASNISNTHLHHNTCATLNIDNDTLFTARQMCNNPGHYYTRRSKHAGPTFSTHSPLGSSNPHTIIVLSMLAESRRSACCPTPTLDTISCPSSSQPHAYSFDNTKCCYIYQQVAAASEHRIPSRHVPAVLTLDW